MERPYRSHLKPACKACRRRKSRCRLESPSASCLMCQIHGTLCEFPSLYRNHDGRRDEVAEGATESSDHLTGQAKTRKRPGKGQKLKYRTLPRRQSQLTLSQENSKTNTVTADPQTAPRAQEMDAFVASLQMNTNKGQIAIEKREDLHVPTTGEDSAQTESPHIVGPIATKDVDTLLQYLINNPNIETSQIIRPITRCIPIESHMADPVLFRTISRRPVGIRFQQNPGQSQLQIIEKLIEPYPDRLIELYFDHINPCFPVLNATTFKQHYRGNKEKLSPALRACIYANAMILWPFIIEKQGQRCPDTRFIWVQAEDAIRAELLLSPGMSTVVGILLDVGGRPTTSMLGNAVSMGAVVSLSYALGLNRDPREWAISDEEKSLRICLWWGVLIHDRWCSLAYGTPPHIQRSQYDVPLPLSFSATGPSAQQGCAASEMFSHLSSLTEVLGECLEYAYRLDEKQRSPQLAEADLSRLNTHLELWERNLDASARAAVLQGSEHHINGATNLRLAYLSLKMHIKRMGLDKRISTNEGNSSDHITVLRASAQEAAEKVVEFVESLDYMHIQGFWHPVSAFSLASACTLLIRCAIENCAGDPTQICRSKGLKRASDLLEALKGYKTMYGWDIGDICISQCEKAVEGLLAGADQMGSQESGQMESLGYESVLVDELFPSVWDLVDFDFESNFRTE